MNEDRLRLLLRTQRARREKRGWSCLRDETVAAYAEGRLDAAACSGVERHLVGCAFCRDQMAFLLHTQAEAQPEPVPVGLVARAEGLAKPAPLLGAWTYRWAAAAAMVVLSLGVVWQLWTPVETLSPPVPVAPSAPPATTPTPSATVPTGPAQPPGRTVRSAPAGVALPELVFPTDGAEVRRAGLRFRWRDVPARVFYEVNVVSEEGGLVWQGRTESNEATLPTDVMMKPGASNFVWVRAELQDGKSVKSSAVRFRVGAN